MSQDHYLLRTASRPHRPYSLHCHRRPEASCLHPLPHLLLNSYWLIDSGPWSLAGATSHRQDRIFSPRVC